MESCREFFRVHAQHSGRRLNKYARLRQNSAFTICVARASDGMKGYYDEAA
jgi:hypothetical protein